MKDQVARMTDITFERHSRLVELAVQCMTDAECCAQIACFHPARVMAAAGADAALPADACISADELKDAGQWQETKWAPFDWRFERLIQTAVAMRWLPAVRVSAPDDEAVDKLADELGDAVGSCSTHATLLPILRSSQPR